MKNKRDKLTKLDAVRIRVRVKSGESQAKLAREYRVEPGTIHAVVHRKTHNLRLAELIRRDRFDSSEKRNPAYE